MANFCPACGVAVAQNDRFCGACGKPIPADVAPAQIVNQSAVSASAPEIPAALASPPPTVVPPSPALEPAIEPPAPQPAIAPLAPTPVPTPNVESNPRGTSWVTVLNLILGVVLVVFIAITAIEVVYVIRALQL